MALGLNTKGQQPTEVGLLRAGNKLLEQEGKQKILAPRHAKRLARTRLAGPPVLSTKASAVRMQSVSVYWRYLPAPRHRDPHRQAAAALRCRAARTRSIGPARLTTPPSFRNS